MSLLASIQIIDQQLFFQLFNGKNSLKKSAIYFSHSGNGVLYVIFPLLYCLVDKTNGMAFLQIMIASLAADRFLYYTLKKNLKRRRPPAAIPGFQSLVTPSDEFSFPSGHTSGAFLFATVCQLWFGAVALPLYLWASLVGLSRVLLGVHFPGDIVAGAVIGVATGYSVLQYFL